MLSSSSSDDFLGIGISDIRRKVLIDGNARSNQATGGQDIMAERKRARTESSKPEGITREDYVKELTEEQVGARLQGHSRRRSSSFCAWACTEVMV
jgi:hypothetical protein